MNARLSLTIAAIVAGIFGLLMLAAPSQVLQGFGTPAHVDGVVVSRDVGGLYVGLSILFWIARSWPAGPALHTVLLVGVITQAISAATNAWAAATGTIGPAAWPGVGIHVGVAMVLLLALRGAGDAAV